MFTTRKYCEKLSSRGQILILVAITTGTTKVFSHVFYKQTVTVTEINEQINTLNLYYSFVLKKNIAK